LKAFLSYQTTDKIVASKLKIMLEALGISSFLAHEDIQVSEEWRLKILSELSDSNLFVAVLSKDYYGSIWCVQESGIAASRHDITILPVSIDGTIPSGFFGHVQSSKIDSENPQLSALTPGLFKCDQYFTISALIVLVGKSRSFRSAEYHFGLLLPYLNAATDQQKTDLLRLSTENGQVCNAGDCATKYLPPLLATHGKFLDQKTRVELEQTLARYKRST
jgi:hypothetical protein